MKYKNTLFSLVIPLSSHLSTTRGDNARLLASMKSSVVLLTLWIDVIAGVDSEGGYSNGDLSLIHI